MTFSRKRVALGLALGSALILCPAVLRAQRAEPSKFDALLEAQRKGWYVRAGADGVWVAEGRVDKTSEASTQIGGSFIELEDVLSIERRYRSPKAPLVAALIGGAVAGGLILATTPYCGDSSCPTWKTYVIGISATAGLAGFGAALLDQPQWRKLWPPSSD